VHVIIRTVDTFKNKYTVKEDSDAHKAPSIQEIIRRPSNENCIKYVKRGRVPNCSKGQILGP